MSQFCNNCGAPVNPGAGFCPACGAHLRTEGPSPEPLLPYLPYLVGVALFIAGIIIRSAIKSPGEVPAV